jgi:hypothetical protein
MKTMNTFLTVAAAVAVFSLTSTLYAGDDGIAASPRLRSQLNEAVRVSDSGDKLDRTVAAVSPRALATANSFSKEGSAGGDKIHRALMSHSPKLHEASEMDFRVAPVK